MVSENHLAIQVNRLHSFSRIGEALKTEASRVLRGCGSDDHVRAAMDHVLEHSRYAPSVHEIQAAIRITGEPFRIQHHHDDCGRCDGSGFVSGTYLITWPPERGRRAIVEPLTAEQVDGLKGRPLGVYRSMVYEGARPCGCQG